jgi:hypothetical protein
MSPTLVQRLTENPKKVFFIDGAGASLTTTLLLSVVLPCRQYFGLPQYALYVLSGVAGVFAIYSLSCAVLARNRWSLLLIIIAVSNSLYCAATLMLLIVFRDSITWLAVIYFVGETVIMIGLVSLEIKIACQLKRASSTH